MHNAPSPPPYNAAPGKPPSPNRKAIKKRRETGTGAVRTKGCPAQALPNKKKMHAKNKKESLTGLLAGVEEGIRTLDLRNHNPSL